MEWQRGQRGSRPGRGGMVGGGSADYNMIISVFLPDSIDWPAPVSPQAVPTPFVVAPSSRLTSCLACLQEGFSFYLFYFFHSWQEKGIRLWFKKKKKIHPTSPVATLVFPRFSSRSPWLHLSLYRLPSPGSNLPGLAGTWLKIRKQRTAATGLVLRCHVDQQALEQPRRRSARRCGAAARERRGVGGGRLRAHSCRSHQWL